LVSRDVFRLTKGRGFFGQGNFVCPVLAGVVLCSPGVVLERPAAGGGRHRDKLVSSIFRRKGEELLLRLAGSPVGLVELAE